MPSDPSDLRATGDAMQSALSRVLEHFDKVLAWVDPDSVPYEVRMAVVEGRDAVDAWTALRRQDAALSRRNRRGFLGVRRVIEDAVGAYSTGYVLFADGDREVVPTEDISRIVWDAE